MMSAPDGVIELLNAAMLHPEQAEGYIRQAIEMLAPEPSRPAESQDRIFCDNPRQVQEVKEQDVYDAMEKSKAMVRNLGKHLNGLPESQSGERICVLCGHEDHLEYIISRYYQQCAVMRNGEFCGCKCEFTAGEKE